MTHRRHDSGGGGARWIARSAAFIVGFVAGVASTAVVADWVWQEQLPFGAQIVDGTVMSRLMLAMGVISGVAAVVLVCARQAARPTR